MEKIAGLVLIATGKYDRFISPLIKSIDKWFLSGHEIDIYLFCDKVYVCDMPERMKLTQFTIPHLPWPYPTLYRYKWIDAQAEQLTAKNLYYSDVDMLFVNEVGREIIPREDTLVAVRHPGFYTNNGWGDYKTPPESTAYVPPQLRNCYYAGGFQGGRRGIYLAACKLMSLNIKIDEESGIIAGWADESHWNHYLKSNAHISMSPEYCMVEQASLRKKWGLSELTARLIALAKNHEELRK